MQKKCQTCGTTSNLPLKRNGLQYCSNLCMRHDTVVFKCLNCAFTFQDVYTELNSYDDVNFCSRGCREQEVNRSGHFKIYTTKLDERDHTASFPIRRTPIHQTINLLSRQIDNAIHMDDLHRGQSSM